MNAEPCNPPISILGLQRYRTCHHPSKSKKSIKSSYSVWSHPLSQPWRLRLQPTAPWQALLHPALKPTEVTVLRQSEVRSNHTPDMESNAITRPTVDPRCTARSKYWQSYVLSSSVLWVLHPIPLGSWSVSVLTAALGSMNLLHYVCVYPLWGYKLFVENAKALLSFLEF